MSEDSKNRINNNNVQQMTIGGCTYEIHAIFGDKIKLEDIIAHRVIKDLENEMSEKQAETDEPPVIKNTGF